MELAELEQALRRVPGSRGGWELEQLRPEGRGPTTADTPSWSSLGGPKHQEMSFLEQGESRSWPSRAVTTSSERSHGDQGTKASRWTRQEDVEEGGPPGPREGPQSRPVAESTGQEATFPKATPLAQAAPLAEVDNPPTERDILPSDCAASASDSNTDHLDLGIEFSASAASGDELGLVEERPALCPSPEVLLPRLGWDDELQKPGAQVYMHFMQEHTCYDAMATSSKLVIFDTMLEIKKAFFALVANGVRAAPLWDSKKQSFVASFNLEQFPPGFIFVTPVMRSWVSCPVECHTLRDLPVSFPQVALIFFLYSCVSCDREISRLDQIQARLLNLEYFRGDAMYSCLIILGGMTAGVSLCVMLFDLWAQVLAALAQHPGSDPNLSPVFLTPSSLPLPSPTGQVVGLYSRFDVIHLAAQQTYNHLDMSVGEALRQRTLCLEGVLSCQPHETLGEVIDRIVREQVHRLVLVDETQHLLGVVSLSDILQALVLSPAGIDALGA
uniref:CBS domain-containing protein n=2 Tax=Sus scrofa TaxID=9823 RepID=A0A8D1MSC4_PIG